MAPTCPAGERVRCVGEAKGPMSCATGDDLCRARRTAMEIAGCGGRFRL